MKPPRIGSILDLLPRAGTVEYNELPKFIRSQVDEFRRSGGRTMTSEDLAAVAALTEQIRALGIEQRVLGSKISDVHRAQSELGGTILARLDEMQKDQYELRTNVVSVEKRVDGHDVQIGVHAKKHIEHAEAITGVFKKLVVLEETVLTKRKPRKRK